MTRSPCRCSGCTTCSRRRSCRARCSSHPTRSSSPTLPRRARARTTSPPPQTSDLRLALCALTAAPCRRAPWHALSPHTCAPRGCVRRSPSQPTPSPRAVGTQLYAAALPSGKVCAVFDDCSVLFESLYNQHHPLFASKHARSSCSFDVRRSTRPEHAHAATTRRHARPLVSHSPSRRPLASFRGRAQVSTLLIDVRAWRKDDVSSRLLEVLGTQRRVEGLYLQASGGGGELNAPAMLTLDKRALRLPARWLARGLARASLTFGELQYWERLWGQQGVRIPLATSPFRAAHAMPSPERAEGDAMLLRFSGGAYAPWLRRCTARAAAGAPLCGRPPMGPADCARVWRRFFAASLTLQRACVAEAGANGTAGSRAPTRRGQAKAKARAGN
jgi:hypothetical protein